MTAIHPTIDTVTQRIIDRSAVQRTAYLDQIAADQSRGPARGRLGCANLAHTFAGAQGPAKAELRQLVKPNVGIVSAYNDLLSAHAPFEHFPAHLKKAVMQAGGIAQFAGGVPAMCDGITQGRGGMELSLFSRDVIAMATAIALTHDVFDGALMLGVCDKIVPGMLIGALTFGHLPTVFVPAGPMTSGLSNSRKAKVRQQYAAGEVDRATLLQAEADSYHSEGTCTFYGTANSNQVLMEVMGLHLPGSSFVNPGTDLRAALTAEAGRRVTELALTQTSPVGHIVSEKTIVNACVALLATGGSTNHTLHLLAIAQAAGITLTWDDIADLSAVVPLIARIYPNGVADVNHYAAAGGIPYSIRTLLDAGLLHDDVHTVAGFGLSSYTAEPTLETGALTWKSGTAWSLDERVLRSTRSPFSSEGGLRMVEGNLGRGIVKVSALQPAQYAITAPARVFNDQSQLLAAFDAGELTGDFVAVVRHQGPAANGMPELHKLIPSLSVLQDRGQKVALLTDGRLSGASGKVLAAIHVTPEATDLGPLSQLQDGDLITIDAASGKLLAHVDLSEREHHQYEHVQVGLGRELFTNARRNVSPADRGASFLGLSR